MDKMERVIAKEERGGVESWARHLINSVGVEMMDEQRPPMVPARKVEDSWMDSG